MYRKMEVPNILRENRKEFTKRVKPILKIVKEDFKRDMEQGILLHGLKELISSNAENMAKLLESKNNNVSPSPSHEAGAARVSKLTKPAKVPTWTKDMSLETYVKQLVTWQGINEDVPEYVKYHDLIEELKKNKDIKGLQRFIADHILPVLVKKQDQTVDRVARLLDSRYGRTRTEKVEEAIEDLFKFREDQYEDDDELMLAMRELRQRRVDLKMTFDEFHSVWMLQKLKKRKRMENFELQALRDVLKENSEDVVENFKQKFKEICVEGKRESLNSFLTLYTDKLPSTYYTEAEQREIEATYMGTESEARKRFNNAHFLSQT